ncbi:MAG: hypothetical protein SOW56_01470, partial [Bacteroidaceae bacterium]|nr:hypothetical protein [Bacteroidaceae bacterium]
MRTSAINHYTISTFPRFMYLNIYAFLLLLAGGGIVCFSIFYHSTILLIIEISLTAICIKGAFAIFSSWDDKKRKYTVLMQRNS